MAAINLLFDDDEEKNSKSTKFKKKLRIVFSSSWVKNGSKIEFQRDPLLYWIFFLPGSIFYSRLPANKGSAIDLPSK